MRSKTHEKIGEGIDPRVHKDIKIISKGRILADTKGKTITIKGMSEEDLIQMRQMILDDMKNVK